MLIQLKVSTGRGFCSKKGQKFTQEIAFTLIYRGWDGKGGAAR